MTIVNIGFFENFKSNDTLLIDGDQKGLELLAESLLPITSEKYIIIPIHSLHFVKSHRDIKLLAKSTHDTNGRILHQNNVFQWEETISRWKEIIKLLLTLSQSRHSHNYINTSFVTRNPIIPIGLYM